LTAATEQQKVLTSLNDSFAQELQKHIQEKTQNGGGLATK